MKNLLVLLLLAAAPAFATSLNPCTPNYRAKPTLMSCSQGAIRYGITIHTLMSPPGRDCSGDNYYETHTALVQIEDESKNCGPSTNCAPEFLQLNNGEFSYTLLHDHTTFTSEQYGLFLTNCIAPMNGGASIGN